MISPFRHIRQRGFGAILAILVVVVLGSLAAGIVRFGTVQGLSTAQDITSARAWQAAKAGTEWGLFQAIRAGRPWHTVSACNANAVTPATFPIGANPAFLVSVRCQAQEYGEGEVVVAGVPTAQRIRRFVITATACNSTAACPDNAAAVNSGYVERVRQVVAVCSVNSSGISC